MSNTKRHHFIPVFYLKQFTNENNQFYIYDVKKQTFRGNGKLFYPSQQFYEHYGNTTYYKEESDDIEKRFSKIDSEVGVVLRKITTTGLSTLVENDWVLLQVFVKILYWRIPANTDRVKAYIQQATCLKDLDLKPIETLTGQPSIDKELAVLEKIKRDSDFHKYFKLVLPKITHREFLKNHITTIFTIIPFPAVKQMPKLMSDNPIIYRTPGYESLDAKEYIFPLSPNYILFRHRATRITVNPLIRVLLDMLLLVQAHEYVSCVSKEYPQQLYDAFQKDFSSSIDRLREEVFSCIHDSSTIQRGSRL